MSQYDDASQEAAEGTGAPEVDDGKRTPEQFLDESFPLGDPRPGQPASRPRASWVHFAAEQLHGWKEHAYHEGKPLRLSRAEYDAALKSVQPDEKSFGGQYAPHAAALSKHAAHSVIEARKSAQKAG